MYNNYYRKCMVMCMYVKGSLKICEIPYAFMDGCMGACIYGTLYTLLYVYLSIDKCGCENVRVCLREYRYECVQWLNFSNTMY